MSPSPAERIRAAMERRMWFWRECLSPEQLRYFENEICLRGMLPPWWTAEDLARAAAAAEEAP